MADLVLLKGNPLTNNDETKDIEGVMVGNRWLSTRMDFEGIKEAGEKIVAWDRNKQMSNAYIYLVVILPELTCPSFFYRCCCRRISCC